LQNGNHNSSDPHTSNHKEPANGGVKEPVDNSNLKESKTNNHHEPESKINNSNVSGANPRDATNHKPAR